jgi:membrane protease YdiL (CAAX protease family)
MNQSVKIILLLVWPLYLNDIYLICLDNTHIGLLWILDILFYFMIPVATIIWLESKGKISLSAYGLTKLPHPNSIIKGITLCLTLIIVFKFYLGPIINGLMPGKLFYGYIFPESQPFRFIIILYASLSAGVLEEIVYRGVVTTELRKHIQSKLLLVIFSCFIFAGIHWSEGPAKVTQTFIWAIIPTIWFLKERNLWGPIVCHFLYDFMIYNRYI